MTDQQEAMREERCPDCGRIKANSLCDAIKSHHAAQSAEKIARLEAEVGAKQAEIDRLMLEFCPDEMTPEQVAEWEKHQVPYAPSPEQKG